MMINEDLYYVKGKGIDSNSYLLEAKDHFILIDTGTGMNSAAFLKTLAGICAKKPVKLVINTHCHFDHIGGNKDFVGSAKFAAHALDAKYIQTPDADYTVASMFSQKLAPVPVSWMLKEGDKIENTGYVVMHTPGHTEGSICLYNEDLKILIAGDTAFANGGTGRVDLPGGDLEKMQASLEKLAGINVRTLLSGHGEPVLEKGYESIKQGLGFVKGETI